MEARTLARPMSRKAPLVRIFGQKHAKDVESDKGKMWYVIKARCASRLTWYAAPFVTLAFG